MVTVIFWKSLVCKGLLKQQCHGTTCSRSTKPFIYNAELVAGSRFHRSPPLLASSRFGGTSQVSSWINSLATGRFYLNLKLILVLDDWGISCAILIWMSLGVTDNKSTLAPSHYLNQCWPRSKHTYCVTRSQWVKLSLQRKLICKKIIHSMLCKSIISENEIKNRVTTNTMESKRDSMGHLGTHLVSVGFKGAKMDSFWVAIFCSG